MSDGLWRLTERVKRRNKAVQSSEVTGLRWVGLQPGSYPPKSRGRTQEVTVVCRCSQPAPLSIQIWVNKVCTTTTTPPTLFDDVLHVPLMWNYATRRSLLAIFSLSVHMRQPHLVIVAILTTMKSLEWLGLT